MNENSSIADTLRALINNGSLLVRQEISLARAELEEKISHMQVGVASIVAGTVIASVSLLVLVQALIVAMAKFMDPALATLLVGVTLAVIAFFCLRAGQSSLKAGASKPSRTMHSLRESAEKVKGAL